MRLIRRFFIVSVLAFSLTGCAAISLEDKQLKGVEGYAVDNSDLQEVHRIGRVLVSDQALLDYVNGIKERLDTVNSEPCNCQVLVDTSNGYEAFTPSPKTILLSAGAIAQAESEDEIAALIAHEMSHVVNGDSTRSKFQSVAITALRAGEIAAGGGYGVVLGDALKESAQGLIYHRWDRTDEIEADLYAVELLAKAGYSQDGLKMAIRRLGKYSDSALANRSDEELRCLINQGNNKFNIDFKGCAAKATGSRDSVYEPQESRLMAVNEAAWELPPEQRRRRAGSDVPHFASVDYLMNLNSLVSTSREVLEKELAKVESRKVPPSLERNAYIYNLLAETHAILGNGPEAQAYFRKAIDGDYRTTYNYRHLLQFAHKQNDPKLVNTLINFMHQDIGLSPEMLPYEYYLAKRHGLKLVEAAAYTRCIVSLASDTALAKQCSDFEDAAESGREIQWH